MENLGRFQILDEIGRGGCGIVYRALDPKIGRTVAIKTIQASASADVQLRERFRREARSAGNLSHPSIVTLYEFDDSDSLMFIAMEFVDGPTLADKMENAGPLPLDFVLSVLRAAADALDYAHSKNIVHRDVKPANFMLTAGGQLKMTDFGIAKMQGSEISLTNTGMIIGTAQYMSPEQIAAKPATGRSDQFSLAVIAYEMLTGQKPFQGDSWASVMHQILSSEPPPVTQHRDDLGGEVTEVLRKALAKDPALRFPTCSEFVSALADASISMTSRALPRPATKVTSRQPAARPEVLPATEIMPTGESAGAPPPSSRRGIRVGAGVAAALVAGGAWISISSRRTSEQPTTTAPAPVVQPPVQGAAAESSPAPSAVSPDKSSAKKGKDTSASVSAQAAPVKPAPSVSAEPAPPVGLPPAPAPAPVAVATPPPPVEKAVVEKAAIEKAVTEKAAVEKAPVERAPVVSTPPPSPSPQPTPAAAPVPAPVRPATPAPASVAPISAPRVPDAEDARKAADNAAARRAVDDALNRYRTAFENRDEEALKAIWPRLGRSELAAMQNFFRIARSIQLQLRPSGEPEITATGATVRARRVLSASDERGALPQQDQNVKITLRRTATAMVIESIETVSR